MIGTFNRNNPTCLKSFVCFDPVVLNGTSKNLIELSLLETIARGSTALSFERDKLRLSTTELLIEHPSRCLENDQSCLEEEEGRDLRLLEV